MIQFGKYKLKNVTFALITSDNQDHDTSWIGILGMSFTESAIDNVTCVMDYLKPRGIYV